MLSCPICQTALDDDSIHGGRCFSCGSQVVWPGEEDEVQAVAATASVKDSIADLSDQDDMLTASDMFARVTGTPRPAPLPAKPLKQPPRPKPAPKPVSKPKSRHLSIAQDQQLRSMWQGTLAPSATRMTSLQASTLVQATRRSSLVIRSRELSKRSDGSSGIGSDYELLDRIGEGGMGVVYSARQASIDRVVAVKMLHNDIADLEEPRDKFLSEAVVTAELDHPNIVPIHDLGSSANGTLFYSMKRVQGTPWCDVVLEKTLDENISILLKVCDAVGFAHKKGVVHRDLKPENVMLGDFGEVLVMDWGLAIATTAFRSPDSITQTSSMGGTPAYMSPEMATGPIEDINELSDIYLLGAILFEILTGEPPHFGKDPMDCLVAAAANRIQPTIESGELLDIAMKAMETEPMDRHQTVKELQDAIRHYQSHAESILLSDRAQEQLDAARESGDYQQFAGAVHGFKEALALWDGNRDAQAGLPTARLAYARCADAKEDFDLAASLLDDNDPEHRSILASIESKRRERKHRQQRLKAMKRLAVGLVALVIGIGFLAFVMIRKDRNKAVASRQVAVEKMKEAEIAKAEEATQREAAEENQKRAEDSKKAAEIAANEAAQSAAEAKRQEREAARESYSANIGLVAARAEENAFGVANAILDELADSPFRHWEWGRLKYVCGGNSKTLEASGRVDSVAIDDNGTRIAASTRNGNVLIWDIQKEVPLLELPHTGQWVHRVDFSPDGKLIATACSDHSFRLFEASSGALLCKVEAHDDSVIGVDFSSDGSQLLSCSYDKTAAIWDISDLADVKRLQLLQGHSWWVHDARYSPDGRRIVTVGQDGQAIVWSKNEDATFEKTSVFVGHDGPVFSGAFSPNGKHVVTGGLDKRVMVWDFLRQSKTSIQQRLEGEAAAPPVFRAFDGHRAPIRSVSFSSDGKRIVSGSVDNSLKIWDATTGELHRTLRGHEREVRSAVFSPDGRQVVSGSFDDSVRVWDIGTYRESRILSAVTVDGHLDAVLDARFASNGNAIVTASRDRTARTWDAASGKVVRDFSEGHDYLASAAIYFPNGRQLLTAGGDNTVRIWNVSTGTEVVSITGTGRDGVVALSPRGTEFLTGNGKSAKLWSVKSQQVVRKFDGHDSNVTAVGYHPDGSRIATADTAGVIIFWDTKTGQELWKMRGHNSMVTSIAFAANNEKLLVTASGDRTIRRWDCDSGNPIGDALAHPAWVSSMSLSSDGSRAISSCEDAVVRVWDLETGRVEGTLDPPASSKAISENLRRLMRAQRRDASKLSELSGVDREAIASILSGKSTSNADRFVISAIAKSLGKSPEVILRPKVTSVALSADGSLALTTVSDDRTVRLWDTKSFSEISTGDRPEAALIDVLSEGGLIWHASFSSDNGMIVTLGGSEIRLWEASTGVEQLSLSPHGTVVSADFSPNNQLLVTASWDDTAKIWDAKTGQAVRKLAGKHEANVNDARFSPAGDYVLTCSDDGTARLWNTATGEPLGHIFRGHSGPILTARFSSDGRRIVTASRDRTARVWDASDGRELFRLVDSSISKDDGSKASHELGVLCADFFKRGDEEFIITGCEDGTVKVWNADTAKLIHRLQAHISRVTSVAASPDGMRIVTGSNDSTAKVWDALRGTEVLTLKGHSQEVTSVNFSPDGLSILTASRDGLAIIWPAVPWSGDEKSKRDLAREEQAELPEMAAK